MYWNIKNCQQWEVKNQVTQYFFFSRETFKIYHQRNANKETETSAEVILDNEFIGDLHFASYADILIIKNKCNILKWVTFDIN